jgi:hypothetical protein
VFLVRIAFKKCLIVEGFLIVDTSNANDLMLLSESLFFIIRGHSETRRAIRCSLFIQRMHLCAFIRKDAFFFRTEIW